MVLLKSSQSPARCVTPSLSLSRSSSLTGWPPAPPPPEGSPPEPPAPEGSAPEPPPPEADSAPEPPSPAGGAAQGGELSSPPQAGAKAAKLASASANSVDSGDFFMIIVLSPRAAPDARPRVARRRT